MFALVAALVLPRQGLHLPLRKQALDELAYLINVEPISAQGKFLHFFCLFVLSRKRDLQSEPPWVRMAHHQIFIQSELYMGKIAEIEHVESVPRLLFGGLADEVPIFGEREKIDEGVYVRG